MSDLLAFVDELPTRNVAAGSTIMQEGEPAGALWILTEGEVAVRRGDLVVAAIGEPGTPFGEMSALLDRPASATVDARSDCTFRVADNASDWLAHHPDAVVAIARTLARRLDVVTGYLADLRRQYAGSAGGLGMIDEVISALVTQDRPPVEPGSERDPDPLY